MRIRKVIVILLFLIPGYSLWTSRAGEIVIEAEKGKLTGSASVINSTLSSGGRKVGNMGGVTGKGSIEFVFSVSQSGMYQLSLWYLAGEGRNFELSVNEATPVVLACPATGTWNTPGHLETSVELRTGTNKLVVGNSSGYAPDLDLILLKNTITDLPDTTGTYNRNFGNWKIRIYPTGKADLLFRGKPLVMQTQPSFIESGERTFIEEMKSHEITDSLFSDATGKGMKVVITARTSDNRILLKQNYYLYEGQDFFTTDFSIESSQELVSNYMAPLLTTVPLELLPAGTNNSVWVPFDNDKWVRYQSLNFGIPLAGYEVAALINQETREGFVTGSMEHNVWKTGIRATTSAGNKLERLEIFGGVTSNETRDVLDHGAVKNHKIKSPRIFTGYFEDWRRGMETYADATETLAPRLPWSKGKPFCWNSWGAIQTKLSYKNATEVSQYFADKLQNNNFQNDSTVYIGLDSYWDNISYSDIFRFVRETKARGQNAGIYWTPFVDWAKNPNRLVEGTTDVYYRDIYLYANGKPQEIAGAWAVDPTHPATKSRINLYLNRFLAQGFTFLKLDFMTHGSLESDHYYDAEVQTGIQAYNQGLQYIVDYLDGRMFLNFSISPLFPSQYGHGRRIACDAYASIDNTEYTLNSLTYGWWLDHLYTFNDADNVVLNGVSSGENRARVTSSVITGLFCSGDDFSESGYSSAKLRAETYLTNVEVNRVARLTKAFSPVEAANGNNAADVFSTQLADTLYLAIFNYTTTSGDKPVDFKRVGLEPGMSYIVLDLWNGTKEERSTSWNVYVPRRDVKFLKIYPGTLTSSRISRPFPTFTAFPNPFISHLTLQYQGMDNPEVTIWNSSGMLVRNVIPIDKTLNLADLRSGIYILTVNDHKGTQYRCKVIKK